MVILEWIKAQHKMVFWLDEMIFKALFQPKLFYDYFVVISAFGGHF